jgi:hypothetical protein
MLYPPLAILKWKRTAYRGEELTPSFKDFKSFAAGGCRFSA